MNAKDIFLFLFTTTKKQLNSIIERTYLKDNIKIK